MNSRSLGNADAMIALYVLALSILKLVQWAIGGS